MRYTHAVHLAKNYRRTNLRVQFQACVTTFTGKFPFSVKKMYIPVPLVHSPFVVVLSCPYQHILLERFLIQRLYNIARVDWANAFGKAFKKCVINKYSFAVRACKWKYSLCFLGWLWHSLDLYQLLTVIHLVARRAYT